VHNVPSTSRLPTSLQSDNQTRRPGAINYTMHPRNKDEVRTGHAVPYPSGVNIAGDHFESHTGSSSSGMIGVRAADSNEETFRAEPTARGGGPAATERYLAPEMQRAPHVTGQRVLEHFAGLPALSKGDIASLPSRGDGTAAPNDGLLALDPTIRSSQLNDTTGHVAASPSVIRLQTRYPATVRAIGGGPPDATVQAPNQPDALQRALDRVPGN
jgi:hypothetical protein